MSLGVDGVLESLAAVAAGQSVPEGRLAPEFRWHLPGRHPNAGVHRAEDLPRVQQSIIEITGGSLSVTPIDQLAGADHVVILQRAAGTRRGKPALDIVTAIVVSLDGDQVTEVRNLYSDQHLVDEFFTP